MRPQPLRFRAAKRAGSTALAGVLAGFFLAGCPGEDTNPDAGAGNADASTNPDAAPGNPDATPGNPDAAPLGNGTVDSIAAVQQTGAAAFWSPFSSTPNADGTMIYFVAQNASGGAVYSASAQGGAATVLHAGDPLDTPMDIAITTDGTRLFVADPSADGANDEPGRLFQMGTSAAAPTPVAAAEGYRVRAVSVAVSGGNDAVFFSGIDPADGVPGVFKMSVDGSGLGAVLKGDPLVDPGGITVAASGDIYVADARAGANGAGAIIKITGSTGTIFASVQLGYPAGIALVQDESALLVSGLSEDSKSLVIRYPLPSGAPGMFNAGIENTTEPGGLHRAHQADVYTWADGEGSEQSPSGGAVYLVRTRAQ